MAYWHELYTEETDKQSRYNVIQVEASFVSKELENWLVILVTQSPHNCIFAILKIRN